MTSSPPASRGDKRRGDILKTAMALFNERDTQSVTTNHIAATLGVSVGNLYWHFRDKEAIVRALYAEHHRRFDGTWAAPRTREDAIAAAADGLRRTFTIAWEYRFLYRELVTLTRADPELRRLHAQARDERRDELATFERSFFQLGILRPPERGEAALSSLDDLVWIVTTFWLSYVELRDGALTRRTVLEGARAVMTLFLPFASDENARALLLALDAAGTRTS